MKMLEVVEHIKNSELVSTVSYSAEDRTLTNKIICNLMLISIVICCAMATFAVWRADTSLVQTMTSSVYERGMFTLVNIVAIELSTVAMFMLIFFDRRNQILRARYVARILIILLVFSLMSSIAVNGIIAIQAFYIFQFVCVIVYQIVNDPNLSYNAPWYNPFSRKQRKQIQGDEQFKREKYMPMNFFNLFWVFVIASILGLGIETWYRLFMIGELESRAGLLWGPFSPIYGFGGMLMTIVLNKFWNRNAIIVFIVSALIGAGFETFVSWYMEVAFGIIAWDYSNAFLNFHGRTDLSHAIAWGMLGLMWVRLMLPVTMRIVDAIKMNWRAAITTIAFVAMLTNGIFTLMALDSWSLRVEGKAPQNDVQLFFEKYFGDAWMEKRFETMTIYKAGSIHSQFDEISHFDDKDKDNDN